MTDTAPLTDQQLADRIAATIWERQNPGRSFADCEPRWQADAIADAGAVLAVMQPELDRLRAEHGELLAELDGRDKKARKRWIRKQEEQLGIRFADFRNGNREMDLAMGREMAAAYVAMAKSLLGDGPNYSETKLEFDVKIAESPEMYTLVVQRHAPGTLTPHEARQQAEAEVERIRSELAQEQLISEERGRYLAEVDAALDAAGEDEGGGYIAYPRRIAQLAADRDRARAALSAIESDAERAARKGYDLDPEDIRAAARNALTAAGPTT